MGVGDSRGGTEKRPHLLGAPWRIYYNGFTPYEGQRKSVRSRLYLFCCEKNNDSVSRKKGSVNMNASSRGKIQDPSVILHDWA
jgi:hypothetical protein